MTTTICVKRDLVDSIQGPELPVEIRNGKVVVKLPDGLDLTLQGSLDLTVSEDRLRLEVKSNVDSRGVFGAAYPVLLFFAAVVALLNQVRWLVLVCLSLVLASWMPHDSVVGLSLCAATWFLAVWCCILNDNDK
jgi:hypothetical protein